MSENKYSQWQQNLQFSLVINVIHECTILDSWQTISKLYTIREHETINNPFVLVMVYSLQLFRAGYWNEV